MGKVISTETGNNELQLVEFKVGGERFGINIEKMSKIINFKKPTKLPRVPKMVLGIMIYMGETVPVISLLEALNLEPTKEKRMLIVTHFNKKQIIFEVEEVVGILQSTWENLESIEKIMPKMKTGEHLVTSILKVDDKLISMLDFESVFAKLTNIESNLSIEDIEKIDFENKEIIFAEDSNVMTAVLRDNLKKIGFENITSFPDGKQTLDYINSKNKEELDNIFCLLTDIEMPKMDGLTLAKNIKENSDYDNIKVVLFSSIIRDSVRKKAEKIGVDAQITKPDLKELLNVLKTI